MAVELIRRPQAPPVHASLPASIHVTRHGEVIGYFNRRPPKWYKNIVELAWYAMLDVDTLLREQYKEVRNAA